MTFVFIQGGEAMLFTEKQSIEPFKYHPQKYRKENQ